MISTPKGESGQDEDLADDTRGEPLGLENEDSSGGGAWLKPWDPSRIRITTKHFSLRDVVDQIDDGEIDLAPDFQRDYVWKELQKTRLVESILLGIPLPAFYFNQNKEGTYQVVDGVQRLSTISLFMKNEHQLHESGLEYLRSLKGSFFSDLEPAVSRRFRSTQIVVHVIEPQTPDEIKYDIFNRVNTLGSPLSAQEIRHAMSKDRSRSFLKHLSEMQAFDEATEFNYWRRARDARGNVERDSGRMANRELALRFCAFFVSHEDEYAKHASLDSFLLDFMRRIDGTSEISPPLTADELAGLESSFQRAMINAREILGRAAFRRWPLNAPRRGPINRAVFESQSISLSKYELEVLLPYREVIVSRFRAAFDDYFYSRAVTVATGDPKAVQFRLSVPTQILLEIMT